MFIQSFLNILKRYFLSGVLVVVPLILTYIVLKFLFELIDDILRPLIERVFGYHIFGLGVVLTLLIIILAGILTRNFIGAKIYKIWDYFLTRVPLVRPFYTAAKQLLEAIAQPSKTSFQEVVLVEYPRKGTLALGFLSNHIDIVSDNYSGKMVSVFIPSTPTPVSGMVVILPYEEVIPLDITVEEGIKFLVSGGYASPEIIKQKVKSQVIDTDEVNGETR